MKRLSTAIYLPQQGGVFRTLPDGACLTPPDPADIKPPGCATFPIKSNNYGALPTFFATDVEVDEYAWDYRFSSLGPGAQDPDFTDMWSLLSASHQSLISITGCYCIGEGIDRPGLTINRPAFPRVTPLSFFRVQDIDIDTDVNVRPNNPDDKIPGYCCTSDDQEGEKLKLSYEDGELVAYRQQKEDKEYRYYHDTANTDFRITKGFPRYCCVTDPCTGKTTYQWMHFPRWMAFRDPYGAGEEPIGVIPFIVDLQCDPVNGDFYIYRGELIVHEGHIYDLVWDADAPREDISPPAPDQPPTNPIDLPYDEDYQGNALLPPLVLIDEDAEYCDVLCEDAATLTGRVNCEDTCPPDVCADGFSPDPVLPTYIYETVEGDSETAEEAIQNAKDNVDALDPCGSDDIQEPLVACFVKPIASGRWKVGIAVCCED